MISNGLDLCGELNGKFISIDFSFMCDSCLLCITSSLFLFLLGATFLYHFVARSHYSDHQLHYAIDFWLSWNESYYLKSIRIFFIFTSMGYFACNACINCDQNILLTNNDEKALNCWTKVSLNNRSVSCLRFSRTIIL